MKPPPMDWQENNGGGDGGGGDPPEEKKDPYPDLPEPVPPGSGTGPEGNARPAPWWRRLLFWR